MTADDGSSPKTRCDCIPISYHHESVL